MLLSESMLKISHPFFFVDMLCFLFCFLFFVFVFCFFHQVAFISLFTSTIHGPKNHFCVLDTTLEVLNTWYKLHVMILYCPAFCNSRICNIEFPLLNDWYTIHGTHRSRACKLSSKHSTTQPPRLDFLFICCVFIFC